MTDPKPVPLFDLDRRGRWWSAVTVPAGADTPFDFRSEGRLPDSAAEYGWEPVERSAFGAEHADAVRALGTVARPGVYALAGGRLILETRDADPDGKAPPA